MTKTTLTEGNIRGQYKTGSPKPSDHPPSPKSKSKGAKPMTSQLQLQHTRDQLLELIGKIKSAHELALDCYKPFFKAAALPDRLLTLSPNLLKDMITVGALHRSIISRAHSAKAYLLYEMPEEHMQMYAESLSNIKDNLSSAQSSLSGLYAGPDEHITEWSDTIIRLSNVLGALAIVSGLDMLPKPLEETK